MRGVVLAGGHATRLHPSTIVTNKHLLPVYDKPMLFYPLGTLARAGIREIMMITGPEHMDHFRKLLGERGEKIAGLLGLEGSVHLDYGLQEKPGGIAQALGLTREFGYGHDLAVILGDNIYQHVPDLAGFKDGARIFLKQVPDPKRFGVATLDAQGNVIRIVEKPNEPESDLAVTGLYLYDKDVYDIVARLKPSSRDELEITDVNNAYIRAGKMDARVIQGWWSDAGTPESLYRAATLVREQRLGR